MRKECNWYSWCIQISKQGAARLTWRRYVRSIWWRCKLWRAFSTISRRGTLLFHKEEQVTENYSFPISRSRPSYKSQSCKNGLIWILIRGFPSSSRSGTFQWHHRLWGITTEGTAYFTKNCVKDSFQNSKLKSLWST